MLSKTKINNKIKTLAKITLTTKEEHDTFISEWLESEMSPIKEAMGGIKDLNIDDRKDYVDYIKKLHLAVRDVLVKYRESYPEQQPGWETIQKLKAQGIISQGNSSGQ